VAVAAARKRLTEREVEVTLPGGTLHVAWGADNRIRMTGPVTFEYEGTIDLSKLATASV
jgi:diaminopimelate epimerase